MIEQGEYGLALVFLADGLEKSGATISAEMHDEIMAVAAAVGVQDDPDVRATAKLISAPGQDR
jgi:hypothetical protein